MSGYIGATVVGLDTTAADVTGDITASDTSPELTLKNSTHEDTDGGREGKITFKGEQSGGEESTLAQIQASHDGASDDEKGDLIFKTNDGSDGASPTERARFDSSGNLLVGTTDSAISNVGAVVFPSGVVTITNDGGRPLRLNRKTSDGKVAQFDKDGTEVGSIGTRAGRIKIGDGDVGLFFDNTNNRINPEGPSDTSANDDAIDLGGATQRFKDLYLSSGVYLGGTGSANKLEDVESGTWTPTGGTIYAGPSNSSSLTVSGTYKKIDNRVLLEYEIDFNLSGDSVAEGNRFIITGLPFGFAGSFVGGGQAFQYGTIGTGQNAIWHNYFHSTSPDYIGFYCHFEHGSVAYNKIIKGNAWYLTA